MNELLVTVFTGVIALSTVAYTLSAWKQWKATRHQADIARYTALANLLQMLVQASEQAKAENPASATFWNAMTSHIIETGFARLVDDLDLSKDQEAREYFIKIEGMLRAQGVDPSQIPWMQPVMNNLKR